MIANFFNKTNSKNNSFFIIVFLFLYVFSVSKNIVVFNWYSTPLLAVFYISIIKLKTKNKLTPKNEFTLLFLIILTGFFPQILQINSVFLVNLLLLYALNKIYSLQEPKKIAQKVFDASFWIGVSFLIEPTAIIFIVLLYLSIIMHNNLSSKTIVLPFLAFFIPLFWFFAYSFYTGQMTDFYDLFSLKSNFDFSHYQKALVLYQMSLLMVFILGGVIMKSYGVFNLITTYRVNWFLILTNFLFSFIMVVLSPFKTGNELLYLFLPISVILANGLELVKDKEITDGVLILFLISTFMVFFI